MFNILIFHEFFPFLEGNPELNLGKCQCYCFGGVRSNLWGLLFHMGCDKFSNSDTWHREMRFLTSDLTCSHNTLHAFWFRRAKWCSAKIRVQQEAGKIGSWFSSYVQIKGKSYFFLSWNYKQRSCQLKFTMFTTKIYIPVACANLRSWS